MDFPGATLLTVLFLPRTGPLPQKWFSLWRVLRPNSELSVDLNGRISQNLPRARQKTARCQIGTSDAPVPPILCAFRSTAQANCERGKQSSIQKFQTVSNYLTKSSSHQATKASLSSFLQDLDARGSSSLRFDDRLIDRTGQNSQSDPRTSTQW